MSDSTDLKHLGLKATLARLWILDVFRHGSARHLAAEEVYRQLRDQGRGTSLATVYRVLAQLEQAGLLRHQRFAAGKAVYELDDGGHHDHLICTRCGRVQEFHDDTIEQRQRLLARTHGFAIVEHSHTLYGRCLKPDCEHLAASGSLAITPGS
ncbi:ferric iron uptake transcriptional regulator [Comamonas testosteroni]|uniref:ferric iron uptake transcriptional regulator n=1 Tax=Comamonas testosteroni TaxID=285 RepID=UPI0015FD7E64|nr:ferric iron uptake transcriptional regulator [Comamonas testosteroni]